VPKKKAKLPLSKTHPKLAKEADGWDPSNVAAGHTKKLKWRCSKGHTYKSVVSSRTSKVPSGCPICSNQQILPGYNDLGTRFPEIAKEADGWDPSKVAAGSRVKKKWRCSKGHPYEAALYSRTGKNKKGCPICSNQQILTGYNDLATRFPEIAKEADGWDPRIVMGGTHLKLKWKCIQGHSYEAAVSSRVGKLKTGCAICAGKKILTGFNDLSTLFPHIASEADGWNPKILSAGSHRKMKWKCPEGHKYISMVVNRTRLNTGCPTCNIMGFDPNKNGFLYFCQNLRIEMNQIGITNNPEQRISRHNRSGWDLIELRGPMDGQLTRELETAILRMLKAKGADLSNGKIAGKFDGYSEAWSKSTFTVKSIKELIRLTEEFEEEKK
jgi:hypothetical protein